MINNVKEHRQKYQFEKSNKTLQYSLNLLPPKSSSKIQKRSHRHTYSQLYASSQSLPNQMTSITSIKLHGQKVTNEQTKNACDKSQDDGKNRIPLSILQPKDNILSFDNSQPQIGNLSSNIYIQSEQINDLTEQIEEQFKRKLLRIQKMNKIKVRPMPMMKDQETNKQPLLSQPMMAQSKNPPMTAFHRFIQIDALVVKEQQIFLKQLKKFSVFFCMKCFKYIFGVQKHFHYPKCEQQLSTGELTISQKHKVGLQRMELLKELSVYTDNKTNKIKMMEKIIKKQALNSLFRMKGADLSVIMMSRKYLSLDEIDLALYSIYWSLLRDYSSSFFNGRGIHFCKAINLDQINQLNV